MINVVHISLSAHALSTLSWSFGQFKKNNTYSVSRFSWMAVFGLNWKVRTVNDERTSIAVNVGGRGTLTTFIVLYLMDITLS